MPNSASRTILYCVVCLIIISTAFVGYSRWSKPATADTNVTTRSLPPPPGTNSSDTPPSTNGQAVTNPSATQPDKEASSHLRAAAKLAKAKAGLDQERSEMEKAKAQMLQSSAMMEAVTQKMADKNLKVPQSVGEAAALTGKLKLKSANFFEKWSSKVPSPDSPEADAYQQEMDEVVTGMAALVLVAQSGILGGATNLTPEQDARFQSQMMASALNLNDSQSQQVNGILNRYYVEAESSGLSGNTPPASGEDGWRQQRSAMSVRAFGELQGSLTPAEIADLSRLYSPYNFLWTVNVGYK